MTKTKSLMAMEQRATAQWVIMATMMTMAMGDDDDDNGNGATGNVVDDHGDGTMGNDEGIQ